VNYEIKKHDDPVQAPELGTLGIPRAESTFTGRQVRIIAWLAKAKANTKTAILSTDVVTLLLVEGAAKAIARTLSKFEVLIASVGEQSQPTGRDELWKKTREPELTGN
jgi:hypothetical protein